MRTDHRASWGLVLACVFWGAGFTWAKEAGELINLDAGLGRSALLGPVLLLAARFFTAGIIWPMTFKNARRGWTFAGVRRGLILGFLLALGLVLQHWGLDRTSEAVSAFLTNLTALFVPVLSVIFLRKRPSPILWGGVIVATLGIWLMTGATPRGFGAGEMFGVACGLTYAVYILSVNQILPKETPWRMTAAQFLVAGLLLLALSQLLWRDNFLQMLRLLTSAKVMQDWILLTVLTTLVSFGLLTHFQPRVDASRAALIYLTEPIFATIYAWIIVHRSLSATEIAGALLILAAIIVVEVIQN